MTATCTRPAEVSAPAAELPFVSVIVPVRNEAAFIARTLDGLLAQDYPTDHFEILVADGRSADATRHVVGDYAACHPHIRLLDNPVRLSSGGRNRAVQAARGDIILLIDGHSQLDRRTYLRELIHAFERSGAECVGRPQPLDVSGASTLQRAIAAARSSWLGHHPDSFIYSDREQFVPPHSVAVAYRRAVFDRVGLFDERFDACEDVEFNHRVARAGMRCFFTPAVAVRYVPRSSLRGLFRQMVRYGRGRVRLARKHPETASLRGFIPGAFALGVVAGVPLSWLSPWLALAYACTLGLYAAIVLVASLTLAARSGRASLLPWLPLVFATIHLGAGAGILAEAVAGRRPREETNSHPGRSRTDAHPDCRAA